MVGTTTREWNSSTCSPPPPSPLSLLSSTEYDEALERYIPVLMAQAKIYWERENYPMVEKLFRQSAEFCSEHETWKLNVAHVFFMQV